MNDRLLKMYRMMLLIRRFDEKLLQLFFERKISGFVHTSHGHEAIAVGLISALESYDQIVTYYRGHGHCLARGLSPQKLMAEIMGKSSGYCQGRGGSVQLMNAESGIIAATGIVAEGLPIAIGAALANKIKANGKVVVVFFGDGATNNGMFYESLNCAKYLNLPVVFVCENNGFSNSVVTEQTMANPNIAEKANALGVPTQTIDGTDVETVFKVAKKIVSNSRKHSIPYLLECKTVRLLGHTVADCMNKKNRIQADLQSLQEKCPIEKVKRKLIRNKTVNEETLHHLDEKDVQDEIMRAVRFASFSEISRSAELHRNLFSSNHKPIDLNERVFHE